jgi:myo-inositol-1(or 4)-monophosphatase
MINYKDICLKVCETAKEAGAFIRRHKGGMDEKSVELKSKHDLVTFVDKQSEAMIVEQLKDILPEAGFIAEEGTDTHKGDKYNWIIDPLDGTTNFVHGICPFAVSIALMEDDRIVVGVVYEVGLDECFYAWEGDGAYLNGKRISVSSTDKIDDSLIATGFPMINYSRLEPFMEVLNYFILNTRGVRRLGAAAVDLAYLAAGRFDSFYEYNLKPWDVAAGAFIVQRAGGVVCDFKEGDDYIFGKEIVASNPFLHNTVIDKFKVFNKQAND